MERDFWHHSSLRVSQIHIAVVSRVCKMHVAEVPSASLKSLTVTAYTDAVPLGTAKPGQALPDCGLRSVAKGARLTLALRAL